MKVINMKRIIAIVAVVIVVLTMCTGCASWRRSWKSFKSDIANGLERTVTVYDYSGEKIKSWSGKFDVSESETEVYFDNEDGKRVIIHGGIVINEEK